MTREELINEIKNMTVGELAELVKALEEEFGVSAAAPVVAAAVPGATSAGQAQEEEKTQFDVILKGFGDKKIGVIKVVRELTGLGLKEAKDLVEKAGTPDAKIKEGVTKAEAEDVKKKLEEAGAEVEIK